MKKFNIAIVGATGMVGRQMLIALEEFDIPVNHLYLYASARSLGQRLTFKGVDYAVEALDDTSFDRPIDYALFSAGGEISRIYAPIAAQKGVVVIDNSSAWRMDPEVPLVVPEINMHHITSNNHIIANPNCSTIQSVLPLKAIDDLFRIKRIVYSTYQAVSGSGIKGKEDLARGLKGEPNIFYIKPIAGNVIPLIDTLLENGYTKEEIKMIEETKKILDRPDLNVTATCVRVPVENGHSVSINVECEQPIDINQLIATLQQKEGLHVALHKDIPTPLDVSGQNMVHVGRIRKDPSVPNGINLWVVGDNIRKGAAINAVQIMKKRMESQ